MLKILILFLLSYSCATGGRDERFQLKNYYSTGSYDLGLKFLEESKFYKDEKEKLLFLMEKGMLLHQKGDYSNSNLVFDQAIKTISENYTISASSKIEKSLTNDNADKFYGEIFEQSMLYFYSSLNSILLFNSSHNREDLFRARASILAWDSFLNSIKEERVGKTVYKNDLLLKVYGAKIHELVGTREDLTIAKNLYIEAEDVLFKNYNNYKAFNSKFLQFNQNFEKLPTLKIEEVKSKYIDETNFITQTRDYIKKSLKRLSKKQNSSKEVVTVLLQKDLIAAKVPNKVHFGMEKLSNEPLIRFFVANVLGLYPMDNRYEFGKEYAGAASAGIAMKLFTFAFEIPQIEKFGSYQNLLLNVKDKNGKIIHSDKFNLINPLADIANEAVNESSLILKARLGARLATKHIAAIMTSFATYKALGGGNPDKENYFAKNAAIIQYAGLTRAIEASEIADTRYWSTLPNEIRLADIELDPGQYTLELENADDKSVTNLGQIQVNPDQSPKIFSFRK